MTPEDYAAIALRHPEVQRAAAIFRWTGHGHTVFVTIARFGEEGTELPVGAPLLVRLGQLAVLAPARKASALPAATAMRA